MNPLEIAGIKIVKPIKSGKTLEILQTYNNLYNEKMAAFKNCAEKLFGSSQLTNDQIDEVWKNKEVAPYFDKCWGFRKENYRTLCRMGLIF